MKQPKIDAKLIELLMRATRESYVELEHDDPRKADRQLRVHIKYLKDTNSNIALMLPPHTIKMLPGKIAIVWKEQSGGKPRRRLRPPSKYTASMIAWCLKEMTNIERLKDGGCIGLDADVCKDSYEMVYTQWIAAERLQDSFVYDEVVDESYQRVVECSDSGQRFLDLTYRAFTDNLEAPILPDMKGEDEVDQDLPT